MALHWDEMVKLPPGTDIVHQGYPETYAWILTVVSTMKDKITYTTKSAAGLPSPQTFTLHKDMFMSDLLFTWEVFTTPLQLEEEW